MQRPALNNSDRYPTYEVLMDRLQEALDAERGRQARCAEALGIDSGTFRNTMKRRGRVLDEKTGRVVKSGMQFSLDELSVIASTLQAPPGWPHLTWRQAEAFEKFLELTEETRRR